MRLRTMLPRDWGEVAELICVSTNYWYQCGGKPAIFACGPGSCLLFCQVYEDLDPGCCVVAEDESSGRLMGSCFYHPRPTHIALGIMNVHPNHFRKGIASALLGHITGIADRAAQPLRLVSSAMNLDSFSLYTRAAFVPRYIFQDMMIPSAARKLPHAIPGSDRVRAATAADLPRMVELEQELSHLARPKDHRYFIENRLGIWHVSVMDGADGRIEGFLCSVAHPASNMLGPGVMRSDMAALALINAELNHHRGRSPVFLVPCDHDALVRELYSWGARNCELHLLQTRGDFQPAAGIVMPTFMPETG